MERVLCSWIRKITAGIHGHGVSYYDGEYTTASGRELCIFEEQEVLNAGVYLYTDEKDYLVKFIQVVRSKYWDTAFWSGDAEFFPGNVGPSEALYFYNPVNQSIVHVESFDNPESLESTRIDPFATYMEGSLDPHVIIHQPDITVEEKWIPKTFSELQGFLLVMALLKDIDIDIQVLVELPNQDLKQRYLHQLLLSRAKHAYSNIPTEQWSLQLGNY